MSDLGDIYSALMSARQAAESLSQWVQRADARDSVRNMQREIEDGISAYNRLQNDLRDGRKHIDPPDYYVRTSCGCGDPGASPPCSWCTEGKEREAEAEFFHPNDD